MNIPTAQPVQPVPVQPVPVQPVPMQPVPMQPVPVAVPMAAPMQPMPLATQFTPSANAGAASFAEHLNVLNQCTFHICM